MNQSVQRIGYVQAFVAAAQVLPVFCIVSTSANLLDGNLALKGR